MLSLHDESPNLIALPTTIVSSFSVLISLYQAFTMGVSFETDFESHNPVSTNTVRTGARVQYSFVLDDEDSSL